MRIAIVLVVLAGCGRDLRRQEPVQGRALDLGRPPCTALGGPSCDVELLQPIATCADQRSGWSGYVVFQIASGSRRGTHVIGNYGDAGDENDTSFAFLGRRACVIGRVELGSVKPVEARLSACNVLYGTTQQTYAGRVIGGDVYESPAAARSAYAERCDH